MDKNIKIVLAVFLLLCLFNMPYGFYQLVRFLAMVGFTILAYHASRHENKTEMIIYAFLALLFQPLFKISLGREIWNVVDVIVGVGLIVTIYTKHKEQVKNDK